jgi:hypothetical protein
MIEEILEETGGDDARRPAVAQALAAGRAAGRGSSREEKLEPLLLRWLLLPHRCMRKVRERFVSLLSWVR